ncbi:MAG: hybrid sensor histidine kinase/response regulator [Anaerolineae bacterium]
MSDARRILYVEDDPASRMLVRQVLYMAGYEVMEAEDGMAGIRLAQTAKPDLILMDINMPGLDGYAAATKIKSLPGLADTPIIAVTANVVEGDRERALTAGCDGYLPKPIDVDALPHQINEFLRGRRERVDVEVERSYLREYSEHLVDSLEEKIAALTRSDEMKSRFIAIAANELRTPITVIRGYLDILLDPNLPYSEVDPKTRILLEGIYNGVRRLHEIVEDMLDVIRIEAGTLDLKIAPVRLDEVAEKAVARHQDDAERRKLTLTLKSMRHLPTIWGDGARIGQMLEHLIGNAIKYTPDGGRITISGRQMGHEARRLAPGHVEGDRFIELIVADTGVGIDPNEQERIFEQFYEVRDPRLHSTSKTDFMGGGAGLGLAITRGVAEAHGGWVWVESEGFDPQRCPGSRFHVVLPVGSSPDR